MKKILPVAIVASILTLAFIAFKNKGSGDADVEYRYSKLTQGELIRSINANGQLVAQTTVDVKSKAGGRVVKLLVEEGSRVKKGDLIAYIDPSDTQAVYDQSSADYQVSQSRARQAEVNARLQSLTEYNQVKDAQEAVELAKIRLDRAKVTANSQPDITNAQLRSAKANLESAKADFDTINLVTIPQQRKDGLVQLQQAETTLQNAINELSRQRELLLKEYVSKSAVERAETTLASAKSSFEIAQQRYKTLEPKLQADLKSANSRLKQALEQLKQAEANLNQIPLSKNSVQEAEKSLSVSQLNLEQAKNNLMQIQLKNEEALSARASTVRSRVSLDNAKVQLDSTTVTAPRDGVVTLKYLEEGTIIPPGTSTFAQGTSLVQISDIEKMYIECAVNEADILQIKSGQEVRVLLEALPNEKIEGRVTRINPAAITANNITAIKVRIEILDPSKYKGIVPGMNATCEFLTLKKSKVMIAPSQAIKSDKDGNFVLIKQENGAPKRMTVKIGEIGNDGTEILEGLTGSEEVVTAEIDLKQLRDTQRKMQEAQQGGGLAGGSQRGGGSRTGGSSGSSGGTSGGRGGSSGGAGAR